MESLDSKLRSSLSVFCAVALFLALASAAFGQEFRATITGRVTDPSGSVVPGAEVTAVRATTNTKSTTLSTQTGDYILAFLQPGEYRVEVKCNGFKSFIRNGIVLQVQDRITVDVVLEVGSLTETVSVSATASLLDTASASLGEVISGRVILDMPLNGRNPFTLIGLVPGALPTGRSTWNFLVRTSNASVDETDPLSLGGGPNTSNDFLLDGISMVGGRNNVTFFPSVEATEEFKVQTNSFDAEFGRFSGGVVNFSTKSGTNHVHGVLGYFHRNSALNARDFFAASKPKTQYHQFAVALGGPVYIPKVYSGKDRTFFFFNYDGSREGVPRSFVSTVPTTLEQQGDFSQTFTRLTSGAAAPVIIYDPATTRLSGTAYVRDAFPGNKILPASFDPVAANVVKLFPAPNATGDSITNANNYRNSFKDPIGDDGIILKIDHRFNERHQVFLRLSWRHYLVNRQGTFRNYVTGDKEDRWAPGFAFDDTITLNPSTVLNYRIGVSRIKTYTTGNSLGLDLTQLGFSPLLGRTIPVAALPAFSISGYTAIGKVTPLTSQVEETRSARVGLMHQAGSHSLRLGANVRGIYQNAGSPGSPGSYSFSSNFTRGPNPQATSLTAGNALASFLLGAGSSGSVAVNTMLAEQTPYYEFYLQDDFRVTSKLVLNLGVRYEWEGGHTERYNRMNRGFALGVSNPLEAQAAANYAKSPIPEIPVSQFSVKGGLLFAGIDGLPRNIVNVDRNNVSPRLGAAYTLTPSTVVRTGFGLFYGPTTLSSDTSLGFNTTTTWNTSIDGGRTMADPLSNPFPGGILQPPGAQQRLLTLVGQGISFADIARPQLYTTQFQFSVERQLPGQMLIQGAYSGSRGHALPVSQQIDPIPDSFRAQARQTFISTQKNTLNDSVTNPFYGLIQSGTLAAQTVTRGQLLRPYPQFTSVSALSRSLGGSQYNSFQGKISKRFSRGFNFLVSYTISKLLSEDTFLNDTDTELVRRLATFDVPQVLVVSGVFELPIGKGHLLFGNSRGIWGKLVEGWQANGVYSAQSGVPLDVSSAESLGRSAKIPSSQRTLQRWLDASAFRLRETLELVATNRLPDVRSQGRNNLDFSLLKVTSITELCKLQFRAEAFNIFNRAEFAAPNMTFGSSAFGTTTSQINYARQLQLGLRLIW